MNAVDIAIVAVLAVLLLKGLWLGLIHELCALAGLGLGTILAVRYHMALAEAMPAWANLPPWLAMVVCFAVLFLVTLICFVLLGVVLSRFLKLIFLGGFNRVLGGLFGLMQGTLLLALVLYGLSVADWLKESRRQSQLAPPFTTLGERVVNGGRQLLR
ncbi:MAG: CvpA family protein [Desulfuromonas sp.]|nr:CvpA family protein [Desulfuromonas sp.]